MTKKKTVRIVLAAAIAVLLLGSFLLYSRPLSLLRLYPMLTPDACTGITASCKIGPQAEATEFTAAPGSAEFQKLTQLFYEQTYRRGFRSLFQKGGRVHRAEPNDFQWEVTFRFENVVFPDGSIGSGDLLRFQNWYGQLDIHFDGGTQSCRVPQQETWAEEILHIIQ